MKILFGLFVLSSIIKTISSQKSPLFHEIEEQKGIEQLPPQDRLLQQNYESIRIYADYSIMPQDNMEVNGYIQNQLLPSAISYYQKALKVIRIESNLKAGDFCQGLKVPKTLIEVGVPADLILLVTAEFSMDRYLAFSFNCAQSETNQRPIFGGLSFNLRFLQIDSGLNHEKNFLTILHEMAHLLGFSGRLYEYFVNPLTNEKLTSHLGNKTVNGIQTNFINVEPLTTKLREYFKCDTLEGAYLENQDSSYTVSSHFERRIFYNELMTSDLIDDVRISEFTLALLEGSGWYKANYSMAEPLSWGKGKGCEFLDNTCIDRESKTPNFGEFCGSLTYVGCTYTAKAVGYCGTLNRNRVPSLPVEFDYWGTQISVADVYSDNCPYYIGYPELNCEDPTGEAQALLREEVYAPGSRCFTGTLSDQGERAYKSGYCLQTKCEKQGESFVVKITIGNNIVECIQAGNVTVSGLNGNLECPDPENFCGLIDPKYCKRGCSGRGNCSNEECECPEGWGGEDCSLRKAENCTRCGPICNQGKCYGDGCLCDEETNTNNVNNNNTENGSHTKEGDLGKDGGDSEQIVIDINSEENNENNGEVTRVYLYWTLGIILLLFLD